MLIAGIDYSITCPTICIHDTNYALTHDNVLFYFKRYKPAKKEIMRWMLTNNQIDNIFCSSQKEFDNDIQRFFYLADWTLSIVKSHKINLIVLENYALGAKGKVFNIAEATGIMKTFMSLQGINIVTIEPTRNKKIFTGKGNANKEKMICQYNLLNDIDISEIFFGKKDLTDSPVSDIVDSFSLIYSYLKEYQNYGNTKVH